MNSHHGSFFVQRQVAQIENKLGNSKLTFLGPKGEDARSLLRIANFDSVLCEHLPLREDNIECICISTDEIDVELSGWRDYIAPAETFLDNDAAASRFLFPHSPKIELEHLELTSKKRLTLIGMSEGFIEAIEDKPLVEKELKKIAVPTLQQSHFKGSDIPSMLNELRNGPTVIRTANTSAGRSIFLADDTTTISELRDIIDDSKLVSLSRYISTGATYCVGGTVYKNGEINVYPPALQLTGIEGASVNPFGSCGNDFAAAKELPLQILSRIESIARQVGTWLHAKSFTGPFGIDLLVDGNDVLFVELNPRMQAGSDFCGEMLERAGIPGPYLDALSAQLECEPVHGLSMLDLMDAMEPCARIIIKHGAIGRDNMIALCDSTAIEKRDVPESSAVLSEHSPVARYIFNRRISTNGKQLDLLEVVDLPVFTALEPFIDSDSYFSEHSAG